MSGALCGPREHVNSHHLSLYLPRGPVVWPLLGPWCSLTEGTAQESRQDISVLGFASLLQSREDSPRPSLGVCTGSWRCRGDLFRAKFLGSRV